MSEIKISVARVHNKKFDDIAGKLNQIIRDGCLSIERDAKRNCPVDTGNLRASITTDMEELSGEVGTNVEYAAFVEFGTKNMAAQPYLYPAYQEHKQSIVNKIKGELND